MFIRGLCSILICTYLHIRKKSESALYWLYFKASRIKCIGEYFVRSGFMAFLRAAQAKYLERLLLWCLIAVTLGAGAAGAAEGRLVMEAQACCVRSSNLIGGLFCSHLFSHYRYSWALQFTRTALLPFPLRAVCIPFFARTVSLDHNPLPFLSPSTFDPSPPCPLSLGWVHVVATNFCSFHLAGALTELQPWAVWPAEMKMLYFSFGVPISSFLLYKVPWGYTAWCIS